MCAESNLGPAAYVLAAAASAAAAGASCLANLAYPVITCAAGESQAGLARVAHRATLGRVIAMGLCAIGIADDIVNLAFALI